MPHKGYDFRHCNHAWKGFIMKKQQITAALTAVVLSVSALSAFAQPGPHGPKGQGQDPHSMRKGHQGPQQGGKHHGPASRPHAQPQHPSHPHGMPPGQAKRMGAGPHHNWVKGTRLPVQYRSKHYVVNDWHGHGLKRPPHGYHWVQYGGDYLLVAIATGVIAQLILSN